MKYIFTLLLSIVILTGCGSTYKTPIPKGQIEDSGVIITARDGSFKLSGEFETPFVSEVHFHSYNKKGTKLIKAYQNALGFNAKHVLVKVPNREKELYGVLSFDNADNRGIGAGVNSYKIIIPQAYIDATRDGKISVIYEYYHIKNDELTDLSDVKKYSWILWLSDEDVFN